MTAAPRVRPKVLVVDDDPDLLTLAGIQLGDGFEVVQAADGRECLDLALEHIPDVIVLDIMMPGMNGGEVLTALSENPATRDIPVIFLSALTAVEDKVKGLDSGAIDYITKPADGREFNARVSAAARRSQIAVARGSIDRLTGLPGRSEFSTRLAEELVRSRRTRVPLSLVLIDIDHLDEINKQHGRARGDAILKSVAGTIRATLRTSDLPFRYGSDEFAVLLPDADVSTAYLAAERLRRAIAGAMDPEVPVTVSLGVEETHSSRPAEEVVAKAEIALYRAKESGGDLAWRGDDPRRHGTGPVALSQDLTQREWDVLAHLVHRRTEQEIARRLSISAGTIRSHKARIRRKLDVPPEIRLSEFARRHFSEIVNRIADNKEKTG
jgi:diguanylate cyclase (GGDEF)-like protein